MILLNGKSLSNKILKELKEKVSELSVKLHLGIILVGDDPSSLKYIELKQKAADLIGIVTDIYRFPKDSDESSILDLVNRLNDDPKTSGFFIQLPLPPNLNTEKILNTIDPRKDVDGLNPRSGFIPAVALGIFKLLDEYRLISAEKTAVIINDSNLIGIPLKKLLEEKHLRVIICNESTENIPKISRGADILISATGAKGIITTDYIKPSAIVVDAASGDVDFTAVSPICSYITPTFGGVGPMTVACLLYNLVNIFSQNVKPNRI